MTVAELIAALQRHPADMRVTIVYDSAVCNEDITFVAAWRPRAYSTDDPSTSEVVVGLFEQSSEHDFRNDDPEDHRRAPQSDMPTSSSASSGDA